MPLEILIALILVLPVLILFTVFVWYLNIGRAFATVKENRQENPAEADSQSLENDRL